MDEEQRKVDAHKTLIVAASVEGVHWNSVVKTLRCSAEELLRLLQRVADRVSARSGSVLVIHDRSFTFHMPQLLVIISLSADVYFQSAVKAAQPLGISKSVNRFTMRCILYSVVQKSTAPSPLNFGKLLYEYTNGAL